MKKSKIIVSVLGAFMFLNMYSANVSAEEAVPDGYVVMSAEKFVLGEGFVKTPEKVPFYNGETGTDITDRFFGKENLNGAKGAGTYIASVKDTEKSAEVSIPQYILDAVEKAAKDSISSRADNEWLSGSDYYPTSGWVYKINNEVAAVGLSDYTPKDGDVIRYEFSLYEYGADIGADNSSWGGAPAIITEADRDELYKLMADAKNEAGDAYEKAVAAASKIDASKEDIDNAVSGLLNASEDNEPVQTSAEVTSAVTTSASISTSKTSSETKASSSKSESSPKTGESGMTGVFAAFSAALLGIALSSGKKKNK